MTQPLKYTITLHVHAAKLSCSYQTTPCSCRKVYGSCRDRSTEIYRNLVFFKNCVCPRKGTCRIFEILKYFKLCRDTCHGIPPSLPHPRWMERVVAPLVNNFRTNQIKMEKHIDHHYQQHLLFVESDQDWKTYGSSSSTIYSVGLWSVYVWTYTEPFGPGQNNCICTQRQQSVVCITKGAIESKCDFFLSAWSLDH